MTLEELLEEYYIKSKELKTEIEQTINKFNLPTIITEPILKEFYDLIHNQKEQQTVYAIANKEKRKEEEKQKNNEKEITNK